MALPHVAWLQVWAADLYALLCRGATGLLGSVAVNTAPIAEGGTRMLERPPRASSAAGNGLTEFGKGMDLVVPRQAARARPAPRLQHDGDRLAGAGRLRPPAARPPRARPDDDGEARPRRARLLRRRERPLHHRRLPGQLEEQHLHPLLRPAARRRAGAVRDGGLGPRVREDRRALAERQHPPRDHLEVGGDGRADDGRQDGALGRRRAHGARRREGADRASTSTTRRRRPRSSAPGSTRQRLAGDVGRARASRRPTRSSA